MHYGLMNRGARESSMQSLKLNMSSARLTSRAGWPQGGRDNNEVELMMPSGPQSFAVRREDWNGVFFRGGVAWCGGAGVKTKTIQD